jgi:hypothetical protein
MSDMPSSSKAAAPAKTRWVAVSLASLVGCLCLLGSCEEGGVSRVTVNPDLKFDHPMRLAVLDFDWQPPEGQVTEGHTMVNAPNAGKFVADAVATRLLNIKGLEVMERSKLAQLVAEKDLSQTELVRQGRYQEIGKFLGVNYLVLGTVNTYTVSAAGFVGGYEVSFSCRCVDVNTSQVIWAFSGQSSAMGFEPAIGLNIILDEAIPKLHRLLDAQREKQ